MGSVTLNKPYCIRICRGIKLLEVKYKVKGKIPKGEAIYIKHGLASWTLGVPAGFALEKAVKK